MTQWPTAGQVLVASTTSVPAATAVAVLFVPDKKSALRFFKFPKAGTPATILAELCAEATANDDHGCFRPKPRVDYRLAEPGKRIDLFHLHRGALSTTNSDRLPAHFLWLLPKRMVFSPAPQSLPLAHPKPTAIHLPNMPGYCQRCAAQCYDQYPVGDVPVGESRQGSVRRREGRDG